MLRIFSTHRLFGFLLIGLMITSCGGGTSSNTPSTTSQNPPQDPRQTTPQTLTVRVPSLNYAETITKSTTISDIIATRRDLTMQCTSLGGNPFGSVVQACVAQVNTAYDQAVAFIKS
jgi:ABC-type glycerol-3-phosphate transport system substrate-binding protein